MRAAIILFGSLISTAIVAGSAEAAGPSYVVLVPPTPTGFAAGTAYGVTSQPYSWGWFGARSRPQTVQHRGYYGDRRIWTVR